MAEPHSNTRMKHLKLALLTLLVCLLHVSGRAESAETIWFKQPATEWTSALPIGNGRLGAMVFGGVTDERIQFNEDTLWRGKPHDYVREGAREQRCGPATVRHGVVPEVRLERFPATGW